MSLTEKASYIKGLAEGLALDETKPETKVISKMLDLIDDMAKTIADLEDDTNYLNDYVEELDDDLGTLEDDVYGNDDDDYCEGCDGCDGDDDDDECFEVTCPSCGETVCFDSSIDPKDLVCPACQEKFDCVFEDDTKKD